MQQASIEDIAEQQRKEDETSPTAETRFIARFEYFSPYEFGKYVSSLFHDAVRSSLQYQKLRHGPVTFAFDETDLEYAEKGLFTKDGEKVTLYNRKKKKVIRFATLVGIQEGEHPVTLAFFSVLLGQKRKDTVATLLKFVRGLNLKPRLILMEGGFAVTELFQYLDARKLAWICRGSRMKKREYSIPEFEAEFSRKKYRIRSFLVDERTLLHSSLFIQEAWSK